MGVSRLGAVVCGGIHRLRMRGCPCGSFLCRACSRRWVRVRSRGLSFACAEEGAAVGERVVRYN